jgi:hypothetical protein
MDHALRPSDQLHAAYEAAVSDGAGSVPAGARFP